MVAAPLNDCFGQSITRLSSYPVALIGWLGSRPRVWLFVDTLYDSFYLGLDHFLLRHSIVYISAFHWLSFFVAPPSLVAVVFLPPTRAVSCFTFSAMPCDTLLCSSVLYDLLASRMLSISESFCPAYLLSFPLGLIHQSERLIVTGHACSFSLLLVALSYCCTSVNIWNI